MCVEEVGSMWVMESEEVSNACVEMVVCFMWRDNVQLWYVTCVEGGGGYTSFQANINQPIVVIWTPHVKVGSHFTNIPLVAKLTCEQQVQTTGCSSAADAGRHMTGVESFGTAILSPVVYVGVCGIE